MGIDGVVILGRWPVKSAKFLLGLLKNAQSNAEVNGLDKDELKVCSTLSSKSIRLLTSSPSLRSPAWSFNKPPRLDEEHTVRLDRE